MKLDDIPRNILEEMFKETVPFYGNDGVIKNCGYSLEVDPDCAIRDIEYREYPLFETPEEAILDCYKTHYKK